MNHTLGERIVSIHNEVRKTCEQLGRVSIAIYDPEAGVLHTFLNSTDGVSPLVHYEARLDDVPSLKELARTGECRVIDDLSVMADSTKQHTRNLLQAGFRSSYTVPIYNQSTFIGFLFFDSYELAIFNQPLQIHLGLYAQLLSAMISNDIGPIRTLKGAVKTAREFSRHRDEETAAHLSRMSHYVRLIAIDLAGSHELSEEDVEYMFQFAPLHDIGKIAVPDSILLKPDKLSSDEFSVMRDHVSKGVEIFDVMIREFGLNSVHHVKMLRNIISSHHENFDGSGYPNGLAGASIPLEGRIVRAADVFDALTSARPYKPAWPLSDAMDCMVQKSGIEFDPDCVSAMQRNFARLQETHAQFKEDLI